MTREFPLASAVAVHIVRTCAAMALLLAAVTPVAADRIEHPLGSSAGVSGKALQELMNKPRPRGEIYVSIPAAVVYGENTVYRPFCSPSIKVINSAHETVDEMIFGVRYSGPGHAAAGSTVTRLVQLKAGTAETQTFFSTLGAASCGGLSGELEVIRCVYHDGEDCKGDVRAIAHGAVSLQLPRAVKEKK
jgi:hypothetical protein